MKELNKITNKKISFLNYSEVLLKILSDKLIIGKIFKKFYLSNFFESFKNIIHFGKYQKDFQNIIIRNKKKLYHNFMI